MSQYLFIDGAYLRETAEDYAATVFSGFQFELNYPAIGHNYEKVFYYDCLPARAASESEVEYSKKVAPQLELFEHLHSLPGWHVSEGFVKGKRRNNPAVQKEVDVLLAVDMLTHTYKKNMDSLGFVAGDTDFRPLLEAVTREGMYVELFYDPPHSAVDLIRAADKRTAITPLHMYQWARHTNIPFPSFASMARPPEGEPVEHWESGTTSVNVVRFNNEYKLYRNDPENRNRILVITCTDLPFLKRVHDRAHRGNDERAAARAAAASAISG